MPTSTARAGPLPAYTTTVVGAHSVPRWFEALDAQVDAGVLADEDMLDAQWRASQAALADQEAAGIDIVNGGEMHRRRHNRHSPPNAMLNHFWEKLPGLARDPKAESRLLTRPMRITPKDPNVFHPAAVCTGPIAYADLGLVDEFAFVAKYARDPDKVKVTMTGPHALARITWDEYYGDIAAMMMALAKVINRNLRDLQDAGCRHIQLDEPLFGMAGIRKEEVRAAIDASNQCWEGISAFRWQHVCQGNYAVGAHYDGQIGHRYFDVEEYPVDLICELDCDAILNEGDMTPRYEGKLKNQQLAIGVADVQDLNVESPDTLLERLDNWAGGWLEPERTLITSSCGMNHLPRHIANRKLEAMTRAKALLLGRVSAPHVRSGSTRGPRRGDAPIEPYSRGVTTANKDDD
jgi:5-methyltetrahydropteroyltriglutamate--homocysteine methyltransferase